jgi:hypothetical protein
MAKHVDSEIKTKDIMKISWLKLNLINSFRERSIYISTINYTSDKMPVQNSKDCWEYVGIC